MMLKVNNHIFISPDKYQLTEVKKNAEDAKIYFK